MRKFLDAVSQHQKLSVQVTSDDLIFDEATSSLRLHFASDLDCHRNYSPTPIKLDTIKAEMFVKDTTLYIEEFLAVFFGLLVCFKKNNATQPHEFGYLNLSQKSNFSFFSSSRYHYKDFPIQEIHPYGEILEDLGFSFHIKTHRWHWDALWCTFDITPPFELLE